MPENMGVGNQMPINNEIAPPQESPVEIPAEGSMVDPSMMGAGSSVPPEQEAEMRFNIERLMKKVKDKDDSFKERQTINAEKIEQIKADIVKKLFKSLSELGVDPSNLESINEFLQELQYQDPDLFALFEVGMNAIDPERQEMQMQQAPGQEGMPADVSSPMGGIAQEGMPPDVSDPMGGVTQEGMPSDVSALAGGEKNLMNQNTTNLQENILRQ